MNDDIKIEIDRLTAEKTELILCLSQMIKAVRRMQLEGAVIERAESLIERVRRP